MRRFSQHINEQVGFWVRPSTDQLAHEWKIEWVNHWQNSMPGVFDTAEEFVAAAQNAPVKIISKAMDASIAGRSHCPNFDTLLSLIKHYRSYPKFRNEVTLKALERRIANDQPTDLPIVLDINGRMSILSGNTRMNIASYLNKPLAALIIPIQTDRRF